MNLLKLAPLFVLAIFLSGFVGIFSSKLTTNIEFLFSITGLLQTLLPLVIVLILLSIFIGLVSIITQEIGQKLLFLLLILIAFLVGYLFGNPSNILAPAAIASSIVLFTISVFVMDLTVKGTYLNQIKPKLGKALAEGSSKFMKIFALMLALNFFLATRDASYTNVLIDQIIDQIVKPTSLIVEQQLNAQINKQVEEQNLLLKNLQQQQSEKTSAMLGGLNIEGLVNQNAKELGIDFSNLGLNVEGDSIKVDGLAEELAPKIRNEIQNIINPYVNFVAPLMVVVYFFTLSMVFSIAGIFTPSLAFVITALLKLTGLLKETQDTVEVTRLSL